MTGGAGIRILMKGKREEDYLRVMYQLKMGTGRIRVRDIAKALKVRPPSVVDYLKRLAEKGFVKYEKGETIELTDEGERAALEIWRRREALKRFLKLLLKLPDEVAERETCYLEHSISPLTMDRITDFMRFVDECPGDVPNFLKRVYYYYENKTRPPKCDNCKRC